MITADGERSRKRIPIAKKALATLKMLGLSAKASLYEGFSYKVWRDRKGEFEGGHVTAPFGIYVAYIGEAGFKQFVCDSVQCVAAPLFDSVDGGRHFTVSDIAPPTYSVYVTGPVDGIPVLADTRVLVAPDPAAQWKPPQPVCVAFGAEHIVINATYERPSGHWVDCSLATHCYSDGRSDVHAQGISGIAPIGGTAGLSSHRIAPLFTGQGYLERLLWKQGIPYYATFMDGMPADFVEYQYYYAPGEVSGVPLRVTGADVFAGASAAFKAKAAYHVTGQPITPHSHGHIGSRTAGDVKGVVAVVVNGYTTDGCTVEQIADPNHSCINYAVDSRYLLTLTFYSVLNGPQVVGFDALGPALSALAAGEFYWVYDLPPDGYSYIPAPEYDARILRRLFGYGADDETSGVGITPRDTATFPDGDGTVYSWLRCCDPVAAQRAGESSAGGKLGGFRFQHPEGFVRTPLAMPPEVLVDTGLRPRVLLMTATTYHCIADRANGEIAHLYVGSPFAAWEEVALPDGATMYSIRVVQPGDSAATTGFIGVGKTPGVDGPPTYRIYLKLAGQGWAALSPIPVADVNDLIASWDVCVFGDSALVAQSQSVRQHPVAGQSRRPEMR